MTFVSEAPQKNTELEWWFCHGNYQVDSEPPTFFMTSFFRTFPKSSESEMTGYSLLTASLSSDEACHRFSSWIDQGAHTIFLKNVDTIEESTLSRHFKNACLDEIEKYGPPAPIKLKSSVPILSEDILDIKWDSYRFFQTGDKFNLQCDFPRDKNCQFSFTPRYDRLDLYSGDLSKFGNMAYFTYPDMTLSGMVNNRKVEGNAWFDHQFGDFSWMFNDDGKSPLSWIWAGINLDSGTDIIFMRHMDAKNGQTLHQWVYVRHASGQKQKLYTAKLHILKEWESPGTHIHYPIALRLEVPEIDLNIDMLPMADDQEIPFFGVQRAIWQGAAIVSGTINGISQTGKGRLELNGFGYIFDSREYINTFVKTIDTHLEHFLPRKIDTQWIEKNIGKENYRHEPEGITEVISKPAWDFLSRSGKHWRPLCSILLVESTGILSKPYARLISLFTEFNHTGSLIIDDIEDDSLIRRGKECLHREFGIDVAINLGTFLYFLPYIVLKDYPDLTDHQRLEIYHLIIQVWTRAHIGQGLDIYWSKHLSRENLEKWLNDDLDEKLLQMYAYKTGASVEAVAELACVLSHDSGKKREIFAALGRVFGVAFQIIDDVNNFNDSPGWTKTCGEDISAGKPTYVIVTALKMFSDQERNRFLDIFCDSKLRKEKTGLKEAIDTIKKSGALSICRSKAEKMIDCEWQNFNAYALHCDAKIMLRMLIAALLNYSYDV